VRDPKLRKVIEAILDADDPEIALARILDSDADFISFTNDCLVAIGAAEKITANDGRVHYQSKADQVVVVEHQL